MKVYIKAIAREVDCLSWDDAPEHVRAYIWNMGWKQAVQDAAAGKSGNDATAAVLAKRDRIISGELGQRGPSVDPITSMALDITHKMLRKLGIKAADIKDMSLDERTSRLAKAIGKSWDDVSLAIIARAKKAVEERDAPLDL